MSRAPTGSRAHREREFFAGWTLNPAGDQLRWRRERRGVLDATGGRGLGRVLSIGCGRGQFELMLAGDAERVLGIDLSPESIDDARAAAARAGVEHVEFACADVATFALDEPFDTIVCIGFLHHLDEAGTRDLLRRLLDRLRPGGVLYTQDPNVHGILRSVGRLVMGRRYDAYHSPDERELDPEALRRDVLEAGFSEARIRYMDLALIPGMQLLPRAPAVVMQALAWVDRLWCWLPVARWASGFSMVATR